MKTAVLFACFFSFLGMSSLAAARSLEDAQVVQALPTGDFSVGIGSILKVDSKPQILLGELVNHDGTWNSLMVLDPSSATVSYVQATQSPTPPQGLQTVLKLYPQQGGTCTGYALDDYLLQLNLSGFTGSGDLAKDVSTEEGRTGLLADAINQYYLVLQHRFSILGIMNSYGKKYGFSCTKKTFDDLAKAQDYVKTAAQTGSPVLISFNVGMDMTNGPFKLQKSDSKDAEDIRLWLPRRVGERNGGGHSVVAVGGFSVNQNDYLVMLDSDWDLPRVWDLHEALSDRTAIDEVEFYTCH
ncbi:MAG TPA: hypothetical protein VF412_06000 [Bdellovibrio sp.]|uniref:hypothetical protein n=1 Tax=Bdellovibrio sp. TaxID=28201 RepID=UPI002EF36CC9